MNDNIKIYWMRDEIGNPVSCLATKQMDNVIVYAISTHNPLDKFQKKVGRGIAITRLAGTQAHAIIDGSDVKKRIMEAIVADTNAPQRARDSAKEWLDFETWKLDIFNTYKDSLCSPTDSISNSSKSLQETRPQLSQPQTA